MMVPRTPSRQASTSPGASDDLSTVAINFLLGDIDAQWLAFVETGELAPQPGGKDSVGAGEGREAQRGGEQCHCTMPSRGDSQQRRNSLTPTQENASGRSSPHSTASTASMHSPRDVTRNTFSSRESRHGHKSLDGLSASSVSVDFLAQMRPEEFTKLDSYFEGALVLRNRGRAVSERGMRSFHGEGVPRVPGAEIFCSLLA